MIPATAPSPIRRLGQSEPGTNTTEPPSSDEREVKRPLAEVCVLVVEDVEDSRYLLARLLEYAGAEVREASSGPEALALMDDGLVPDLVVSDIGMPGMDGYELMEAIRERPMKQPPAVAVTAFTQRKDRIRAMKAGYQAHVGKPADAEEVIATLVSLLTLVAR
jgi:CheY-like chemotaxis protein